MYTNIFKKIIRFFYDYHQISFEEIFEVKLYYIIIIKKLKLINKFIYLFSYFQYNPTYTTHLTSIIVRGLYVI